MELLGYLPRAVPVVQPSGVGNRIFRAIELGPVPLVIIVVIISSVPFHIAVQYLVPGEISGFHYFLKTGQGPPDAETVQSWIRCTYERGFPFAHPVI